MLEGSILQKLAVSHQHSIRPLKLGVYYKNTLVSLCHALEDHILTGKYKPLVISAFQEGKWYLQEAERYAGIARKASHVSIMASSDAQWAQYPTSNMGNLNLVTLNSDDPVGREWHLIIISPTYTAMVLCQELTETDYGPGGRPKSDLERKFYGIWTFEPGLVKEAAELAIIHIQQYDSELSKTLTDYIHSVRLQYPLTEELGMAVARVVNYLQTGKKNTQAHFLDRNLISNEIQAFLRMGQIMDSADVDNPMAAAEVMALNEAIGQMLELPYWQIKRLRLAGLLHRIDSLQTAKSILEIEGKSNYPNCPLVVGTQMLRTMPRLRAIAQIITHHTEHWDGSGVPAGLAGDAIPLESRILALTVNFQYRIKHNKVHGLCKEELLTKALNECRQESHCFDPKLLDALTLLVMGLQQGMELGVKTPKVAPSMWVLDSRWESNQID
ncbi:MAG TPA: metal-dependent phosphohydrolase [Richelia sp.]|nr:metal-dependent phosphohydrolase [Richelia sp.]